MRILIYGAGVIGSLYAALFAQAGFDTSIYARGKRLETLQTRGLLYAENRQVRKADVSVLSKLEDSDHYDFIFLTVRENQLIQALGELKTNRSPCIVTMVNSIDDYGNWESICGKGRILPAFPGAGGGIQADVLDASLTPRLIQPTTFAEISGEKTERTKALSALFRKAGIPYQQVTDMHLWQLCHLAMVVPIADAYEQADHPSEAGKDRKLMRQTAEQLKTNFRRLKKARGRLSPAKMNLFLLLPVPVLTDCAVPRFLKALSEISSCISTPSKRRTKCGGCTSSFMVSCKEKNTEIRLGLTMKVCGEENQPKNDLANL